jgi:hypothetical protein
VRDVAHAHVMAKRREGVPSAVGAGRVDVQRLVPGVVLLGPGARARGRLYNALTSSGKRRAQISSQSAIPPQEAGA